MKFITTQIIALCIIALFLLLPPSQAVEKKLVENECKSIINSLSHTIYFSEGSSFLKKIWGILEIIIGISISIKLTRLLSLLTLPIILEIGLGPFVFFLVMSVLLTIPVQLLNGICLHLQKQFSLGKVKTFLLTVFSFLIYMFGTVISSFWIPLHKKNRT